MVSPVMSMVCLSKVLIDRGSGLNIIFSKTPESMGPDMTSLVLTQEDFYRIIPGSGSTPVGQVTLPVTFGTRENSRTEHLHFEVALFETSCHAIRGRPALARFIPIPNHTYLVFKMPAPNGVISIYGDLKASHSFKTENINLSEELELSKNAVLVAESAKKIPPEDLTIPKNDSLPIHS
ncbi:uncharacterized protein LOC112885440 [Panicum hallii]|jgi:hypothetical protein|uniref:uncharacterized protein LOC112885440 n=1 Tax=Panicum hallii TaxID=206008 RepID=UPI000DF4D15E|nr:uncharacterized protein LOC112885440 [Panicum hallii]